MQNKSETKLIIPSDGSVTQRVYLELRRMIITGKLKPGEKLKIEDIREQLSSGASPIREALSLLTSDRLVVRLDQRGFRTADVSADNFQEILLLRCTLEGLALKQSLAHASDEWEERVVLAHHRVKRAKRSDVEAFEDVHKAFHMELLSQAPSQILLQFCSQLYDLNIRYRYLAGRSLNYKKRDVGHEHSDILNAVVARDIDLASERLMHHYKTTGEFLASLLGKGVLAESTPES